MVERDGAGKGSACGSQYIKTAQAARAILRQSRLRKHSTHVGLAALVLLVAAPSVLAYGEINWDWSSRTRLSGDIVRQDSGTLLTTPTSPLIILDEPTGHVAGIGPLATAVEFSVDGRVDLTRRSIGAGVEIIAKETPWDERRPPPNSNRKVNRASVRATLTDEVKFSSQVAELAHGGGFNTITMDLRPSKFDGSLIAPIIHPALGSSVVEINVDFSIFEIFEDGALPRRHHRSFSKRLTSVDGGSFHASSVGAFPDSNPLGSSRIPLENGRSHLIVMTMTAIATLTGNPFPAEDPERLRAAASFDNTLSFGGFFDFQDESGNALSDVRVVSAEGIDWLSPLPVPLPGSLAFLLGGLPLLAALKRSHRGPTPVRSN